MLQIRVLLTVLMTTLKCCCGNDEKVAWHAGTSMAKAVLFISVLVKEVHSVCGNVSALCFSECMLYFSEMCKKQNHYKKRKYQAHIILQENSSKHKEAYNFHLIPIFSWSKKKEEEILSLHIL